MNSTSELRQDLVTGDWVVIATGRGKRPHDFMRQKREPFRQPQKTCPFEHPTPVLATYGAHGKPWATVISNKYPAFGNGLCAVFHTTGPYRASEGVGFHEIVVTREHGRSFADMDAAEAAAVLEAYQERYHAHKDHACVEYISIFHNHGRLSGATIEHPHSQIIAIPVVPPETALSLRGSELYFKMHKRCIHCVMLAYELKVGERVVYQNKRFLVLAPYASKSAFELHIFPKYHSSNFELTEPEDRKLAADALRGALRKLSRGIENPDYNFFIHTAPPKNTKKFGYYHWHIEIIPKTGIWAGFEIGTGIEISTIAPEVAAKFLRGVKI